MNTYRVGTIDERVEDMPKVSVALSKQQQQQQQQTTDRQTNKQKPARI